MIPIFKGTVKNGIFCAKDSYKYKVHLFKLEGKEVESIVRRKSKKRTNKENQYYWGCVVEILSEELGYTPEEMNEVLKQKFLVIHKEPFDTCGSLKKLTTVLFEKKMTEIREWASIDMSIFIPLPNEVIEEGYNA